MCSKEEEERDRKRKEIERGRIEKGGIESEKKFLTFMFISRYRKR